MTNHVASLGVCQQLKEAGFPQQTLFSWMHHGAASGGVRGWRVRTTRSRMLPNVDAVIDASCAAPILAEVLEQLPATIARKTSHHVRNESLRIWKRLEYWKIGYAGIIYIANEKPVEAAALLFLALRMKPISEWRLSGQASELEDC